MTAFIGGGNMAEALIRGMVRQGMKDIVVSEPRAERREHLEKTYGVKTTSDNAEAASASDVVMLAVKPQNMEEVLEGLRPLATDERTFVSIAAGVTLSYLEKRLGTRNIVRVMPNMAARVGEGMAVMSLCECIDHRKMAVVREIFMASGRVIVLPEKHLDAVTALSGSGPAFVALFLGALAEAAEAAGLPRHNAIELAVQTAAGTAKLLDEGLEPAELIEKVRSPGGTTAEGLRVFEEQGLAEMVRAAFEAARRRAAELAK